MTFRRAVRAQLVHADSCGVAGGADGSSIVGAEALRNGNGGLTVDALLSGVAAVTELAQTVAEGCDELARFQTLIRGFLHGADDVNAGHEWVDAHDALIALQSHGVFVVEGGILNIDQRVPFCQNLLALESLGNAGLGAGDN